MDYKFKFGDMLRHKDTGTLFVATGFEEDDGFVAALSEDDAIVYSVEKEKLELIPHTDTTRLNYMGNLVAGSLGMRYNPEEHRRQIDNSMNKSNHQ